VKRKIDEPIVEEWLNYTESKRRKYRHHGRVCGGPSLLKKQKLVRDI